MNCSLAALHTSSDSREDSIREVCPRSYEYLPGLAQDLQVWLLLLVSEGVSSVRSRVLELGIPGLRVQVSDQAFKKTPRPLQRHQPQQAVDFKGWRLSVHASAYEKGLMTTVEGR